MSETYSIPRNTLHSYYDAWARIAPKVQPQSNKDIQISLRDRGRKTLLTTEEEKTIRNAILYH